MLNITIKDIREGGPGHFYYYIEDIPFDEAISNTTDVSVELLLRPKSKTFSDSECHVLGELKPGEQIALSRSYSRSIAHTASVNKDFQLDQDDILDCLLRNNWSMMFNSADKAADYRMYDGKKGRHKEFFDYVREHHPDDAHKLAKFTDAHSKAVKLYNYCQSVNDPSDFCIFLGQLGATGNVGIPERLTQLSNYMSFIIDKKPYPFPANMQIWFRLYANYVLNNPGYDITELYAAQVQSQML